MVKTAAAFPKGQSLIQSKAPTLFRPMKAKRCETVANENLRLAEVLRFK
jgi:hypothetical protein